MSRPTRLSLVTHLLEHSTRLRLLRRDNFSHHLFAKHEQQAPLGGGFTSWSDNTLHFEYHVPKRACIGPRDTLPLGALVALIDEVTTWVSMGSDRHIRPGVSISLEAALSEQDRAPVAGDVLVFSARVEKMGRTLGFQSCEVHDAATGRRVAHGYHSKFLEMGKLWNLALGPLFPFTDRIGQMVGTARPAPHIDPNDTEGLERLLAPTSLSADDAARGVVRAGFTCLPEHLQETHIMFGGVQAMVHEVATREAAKALRPDSPPPLCCAMLVRYLAGISVGDELDAHATAAEAYRGEGLTATSCLVRAGNGRGAGGVRSEAEVQFLRM